jgi:hypothetical protein
MAGPLGRRAAHGSATAGGCEGIFQLERVAPCDGFDESVLVFGWPEPENIEHGRRLVETGMQVHESTVAAAKDVGQIGPWSMAEKGYHASLDLQQEKAVQRSGGMPDIDAQALGAETTRPADAGRLLPDETEDHGGPLTEVQRRPQDRVGPENLDLGRRRQRHAREGGIVLDTFALHAAILTEVRPAP